MSERKLHNHWAQLLAFARARGEAFELGPEPSDPHERQLWFEERRGAVVLLAALAEWNPSLCRHAALDAAEREPFVRRLRSPRRRLRLVP